MLRHVADSLYRALLRALPADQSYSPDAYRTGSVPAPLAHFLDHVLAERAAREVDRLRTTRTRWIDYAQPDVRERFSALMRAMRDHAQVPADEWERTLQYAVYHVMRHAARPLDTLVDFVFEDEDGELPAGIVQQRMQYFSTYSYLCDAVDLYVEQKEVNVLARQRFAALLERVARQMTADYAPDEWLRLLDPLFTLAAATPNGREGEVPATLLLSFFEEHGHEKAQRRLQQRLARDEQALVSRDDLRALLSADSQPAAATSRSAPDRTSASSAPRTAPEPATSSKSDGPVPLWQQFHTRKAEQPEPVSPAREVDDEAVPLWRRFQPRAGGGAQQDDLTTLESAVLDAEGRAQRDRFVRQLFGGSTEAYRAALRRLSDASDWSEAAQIIGQEVFKKHRVNIYSEEAVAFTDAVEARFR